MSKQRFPNTWFFFTSIRRIGTICLLLAIAFFPISCSEDSSGKPGGQPGQTDEENFATPAVEAVKARYGSLPLSERLSGTVRAENQVALYPEINAPVIDVYVQTGEQVDKGDPLVKLQDDQYREQVRQAKAGYNISQARLKQAQSQLTQLQARLSRLNKLREKELSSDQEMETLQAEVESAQADVELAKAEVEQAAATLDEQQNLLSKTTVRAPISGTVGQRNAEVGMQATSTTRLFTIGNLERVKIEVVLTENMLNFIEVGQTAEVLVNGDQEKRKVMNAKVTRISPFLNTVTRSTEAEIEIDNTNGLLKPGMFVPVDILYGDSRQATLVPTSAIYTDPSSGTEGVFVASSIGLEIEPPDSIDPDNPPPLTEPTQVEFKPIEVIARGRMEVGISGIEVGSWVVTVGQNLLSEGRGEARVRTVSWNRILTLQGLQRQDLLQQVLDQNQKAEEPDSPS